MKKLWLYFCKRLILSALKLSSPTSPPSNSPWSSDMSDIKTTREGEHQEGFLTKKNKFTEKEYAEAEKYATRKKGVNKDKLKQHAQPQRRPKRSKTWRCCDLGWWYARHEYAIYSSWTVLADLLDQVLGKEPEATGLTPCSGWYKLRT